MRIGNNNGNVGIGTVSPSNKLHVQGTGAGSAGIYLNDAVPGTTTTTLYNSGGDLYWDGSAVGAAAGTWIGLTDTDPANFTGSGGKYVQVNNAETGLEFTRLVFNATTYHASNRTDVEIQAAIDDAEVAGGTVLIPAGTWTVSSTLTVQAPITIMGEGASVSGTLIDTSASTTFAVDTDNAVIFRDLIIVMEEAQATYIGIDVDDDGASANGNGDSKFENIVIYHGGYSIYFRAANHWTISNSHFFNALTAGVWIDNNVQADAGDSSIVGSAIWVNAAATAAVWQRNSGGLRIAASKLNGGDYCYYLDKQTGTGSTSILQISGNSLENCNIAAVVLRNDSNTASFTQISITGNQLLGGLLILAPGGALGNNAIRNVAITGNTITTVTGSPTIPPVAYNATVYIGGGTEINIAGNMIDGQSASAYGIRVAGGAGLVWQGANGVTGATTTPLTGTFQTPI